MSQFAEALTEHSQLEVTSTSHLFVLLFFSWDLSRFLSETEKKSMLLNTFSETYDSSVAMSFIL